MIQRLNRDHFDPHVLAFSSQGRLRTELEAISIPLTCLDFVGLLGKFHPVTYLRLYRLLSVMIRYFHQEQPQIAQSYLGWANIYGCLAAKMAGVPVIITGRRGMGGKYHETQWHYQLIQSVSNIWATAVIANSFMVRQHCLTQEKFLNPQKVHVIHNGIAVQAASSACRAEQIKKQLAIPVEDHIVGIIANLHRYKGHHDLLQAAAMVLSRCPNTTFVIVGRNDGIREELEHLAQHLQIMPKVIFMGERQDVPDLIAMFDIQVSASLTEGLSNAILEGMASAKPIIATAVGGTPELVVHEQTGLLVPPGNSEALAHALFRLLNDKPLRTEMGNAGRLRVATHFQIDQTVHQTEVLYQRLVQQHVVNSCEHDKRRFIQR